MGLYETAELDRILHEIVFFNVVIVSRTKLLALLGKKTNAAGTWRALLDAWEGMDCDRNSLHGFDAKNDMLVLTNIPTTQATSWI
jgi:hypothetical protein